MAESVKSGLFISYRREEASHAAGRLADRIAERFTSTEVFMDVDSIPAGIDFTEAIRTAVGKCDVLLALIGPRWTVIEDADGRRRLSDPEDFVVLELRAALDRGIPVIPVLIDGAAIPKRTELPPALQRLAQRNAVRVDAETFRQDVWGLLEELGKIVEATPGEIEVSPRPTRTLLSRRAALRLAGGAVAVAAGAAAWEGSKLLGSQDMRQIWSFATGDEVYSSPRVVGGVLYIGSNDGHLYALDALSGKEFWTHQTSGAVTSSPAVADGTVYFGCDDGRLYAVEAARGVRRWAFRTGGAMHSSPAVAEGLVYIGCRDNFLYALEIATGKPRWRFKGGGWFNSSPIVAAGIVYVGCRDHNVYALDAGTGDKRWSYTTGSTVDSSAAVLGGKLSIGGDDHNVYALSAATGKYLWAFQAQQGVDSTPIVIDGVLYVGSDDGNLYAIDADTGRASIPAASRDRCSSTDTDGCTTCIWIRRSRGRT